MSAVVSDTSPLHYLVECEAIEILPALFGEILIPPAVHRELQHLKTPVGVRAWALVLLEAAAGRGLVDLQDKIQRLHQINARLDEKLIRAIVNRNRQR